MKVSGSDAKVRFEEMLDGRQSSFGAVGSRSTAV
jgi:hypothetical protein